MLKLSIIVPTLNSVKYLDECIQSIQHQIFRDFEVLVIDAGSTDGTVERIQEFQKKDNRIKLYSSEKKSYGYQLNCGIKYAKGEYIGIVESDDYIVNTMYEHLINVVEQYEVDYVKSNFYSFIAVNENEKARFKESIGGNQEYYNRVINPMDYPELYTNDIYLWKGIYKKSFLVKNFIRFHETEGAAYQDIGFIYQVFTKAKKAYYINEFLYMYRRNNENSSTYNTEAFKYLKNEYTFVISQFGINDKVFTAFYKKLFIQCMSRMRLMGITDNIWDNAQEDIAEIKEILSGALYSGKLDPAFFQPLYWIELVMMIENCSGYQEYYRNQMSVRKQSIYKMVEQVRVHGRYVLVGKGIMSEFIRTLLSGLREIEFAGWCDKNSEKWCKTDGKWICCSYETAVSEWKDALFIIPNARYAEEMRKQLLNLGVEPKNIFTYMYGTDWLLLNCV